MNYPDENIDDNLPNGVITVSEQGKVCLTVAITPWDNVEITSTTLPTEEAEAVCTIMIESGNYYESESGDMLGREFGMSFTEEGEEPAPVKPSEEALAEIAGILSEAEEAFEASRAKFFAKWEGKHVELFNQFFEHFPEDTEYTAEAGDPVYSQCHDCEESHWEKTHPAVNMNTKNGNRVAEFCSFDGSDWDTEGEYDNESIKSEWGSDFLHDYWNYVITDGYFLGLVRYHCFCAETGTDPIEEWFPTCQNKDDIAAARSSLKYLKS